MYRDTESSSKRELDMIRSTSHVTRATPFTPSFPAIFTSPVRVSCPTASAWNSGGFPSYLMENAFVSPAAGIIDKRESLGRRSSQQPGVYTFFGDSQAAPWPRFDLAMGRLRNF
ncbi:hypothetical protein PILCRDRAFT_5083 [Piloderma croceum F 1598]|uniref:Uncharacterized protein n=1 Tax=Piloderma croceum (strain F 1598) TaxID=765440 RepID=A0A0C3C8G1_PILCF|nr:hypothetical protein PILCRDRAFT_5083 [Piloderma croceum F 1598]